jgi:hypothetical protein
MSAPVDVLAVLDRAFGAANEHYDALKSTADEPALGPAYQRACRYMAEHREVRAAVAELIEMAAVVVAQAKEGREMDIIALADCIDLAGGKDARKAVRARVKGGAA